MMSLNRGPSSWLVRVVSSFLFLALNLACGRSEPSSEVQSEGSRHVLALMMAGNNSCHSAAGKPQSPLGAGVYRNFSALVQKLREGHGIELDFVASCFTMTSKIFITHSDDLSQVEQVAEDQVLPFIRKFRAPEEVSRTILVGHSYGGWLSMKTALGLVPLADTPPAMTLVTIDAISKVNCRVTAPRGCNKPPTDISEGEYLELSRRSEPWLNFFERRSRVVHGSAIPIASRNVEIAAGHSDIDNHPEVWAQIEEAVAGVHRSDAADQ